MRHNQKGVGIIELLLIVAVVAIIGFLGWTFWNAKNADNSQQQSESQQAESEVPVINNAEDLDKASKTLDSTDIEGSDSKQIDTETSF